MPDSQVRDLRIPETHAVVSIGPIAKWIISGLMSVLVAVAIYWVKQQDQQNKEVLLQLNQVSSTSQVTQFAVGRLSDRVDNLESTITTRNLYTREDALRDRERQAAIDQAQTVIMERIQKQLDTLEGQVR